MSQTIMPPKITPMYEQYMRIKEDYPDALLFYRMGDFYELFFGDAEIAAKGYKVIGISKDSVASHAKFADKYSLPFTLLSDPATEVNQAFGVWQKKKMAGREYMGTVRTTFVTDASHRITHIIRKVDTKNAASQLLGLIGGGQ